MTSFLKIIRKLIRHLQHNLIMLDIYNKDNESKCLFFLIHNNALQISSLFSTLSLRMIGFCLGGDPAAVKSRAVENEFELNALNSKKKMHEERQKC